MSEEYSITKVIDLSLYKLSTVFASVHEIHVLVSGIH